MRIFSLAPPYDPAAVDDHGRTSHSQDKLTKDNYGRDHHPRCFTDVHGCVVKDLLA